MATALERLVYKSTATGTTDSLMNLAPILAESQRSNNRNGLTGCLAAHRDQYIQVIEGQSAALDALLRRLQRDPRHKDIVVIGRTAAPGRLFDGWTMANARISPDQAAALDALIAEPEPMPAQIVQLMLKTLDRA